MEGFLTLKQKHNMVGAPRTRGAATIGAPAAVAQGGVGGTDPGLFNPQTGTFTISWDATPNSSPQDVVFGLSNGAPVAFSDFACAVRFFTGGVIEARNGGAYEAAASIPYSAGLTYHIRMVVDVLAHTYSVYVTPPSQSEITLGSNYAFRSDQSLVSQLNYLGSLATTGTVSLTNMVGPPVEALPPVVLNQTFSLSDTGSSWVAGKVVGTMTASRSPTSWAITAGNSAGYFAISNAGVITVTSAGVTGLAGTTGTTSLTVQATNANGSGTGTATINRAPESALPFPKSLNDPMYTGMTEHASGNMLVSAGNATYNNHSWLNDQTTSWSVLIGGNNTTFNKFRLRTREGLRFRGYTGIVFNYLYLEVFGLDPTDHADGMQWEGGPNSVTFRNCHFRCTPGAYTGLFAADGSTGPLIFENCLWTCAPGGGTGLILYADQGQGTIQASFKDCYVQQSGWGTASGPFNINRTGTTYPARVTLWDNVRYCNWDHTSGTLTPGNLMPQPTNTNI